MSKRSPTDWFVLAPAAVALGATVAAPALAEDYLNAEQARKILFPAADSFVENKIAFTDAQIDKIKDLSGVRQRDKAPLVWRAQAKGKSAGWFIVDEVVGKHEFITYAAALSPEGKVLGIEIMTYRETHGGQVRDAVWRKKFVGKSLADPFKLGSDIPNISGATLSCRNLLDGVKRLLAFQKVVLDGHSG